MCVCVCVCVCVWFVCVCVSVRVCVLPCVFAAQPAVTHARESVRARACVQGAGGEVEGRGTGEEAAGQIGSEGEKRRMSSTPRPVVT